MGLHIVWFRIGDLRVLDHEPLVSACKARPHTILPLVILRPRGMDEDGVISSMAYRQECIRRALVGLGDRIREAGSTLCVIQDGWEKGLESMVNMYSGSEIELHYYKSPHPCIDGISHEEEMDVLNVLSSVKKNVYWGRTLFHPEDMAQVCCGEEISCGDGGWLEQMYPGSLQIISKCDTMTQFRQAVQGVVPVRRPYDEPDLNRFCRDIDSIMSVMEPHCVDPRSLEFVHYKDVPVRNVVVRTGVPIEEAAVHVHSSDMLSDSGYMSAYRESRMSSSTDLGGFMTSTALSLGTISPRSVYSAVARQLGQLWEWSSSIGASSPGEEWLLMHLVIRDYFLYLSEMEAKHIRGYGDDVQWSISPEKMDAWLSGTTGFPFVDASMRELRATGFMSNRGRQNVASFLTKSLGIDWRLGEKYFQQVLIDYEPGVNVESWAYVAGVGPGRRNSTFLTVTQGEKYDPEATLITRWIPEISNLDTAAKHRPWSSDESSSLHTNGYPSPILDPASQISKRG